jgi:hypothetical protein
VGYAGHGGTCPLCHNPVSFTATGKLYRHKGNGRALASARRLECRASGATFEVARRLRANKDAGRHAHRNEDGTWLYVCSRCGREQHPWPVDRGNKCAPKDWAHCIKPLSQMDMETKEARNEE